MQADIYEEFLRLTGFEEEEMAVFLSEWRKASAKLGLTADDVRYATREWIPANFEVSLRGVRKMLGAQIKELIDLTRADAYKQKGMKIVYGIIPAISTFYSALKLAHPDKVYVSFPDVLLVWTMNAFFHKINPILELAEREGIPYGCRHCALNKTRYAMRKAGLIPSPDVSWIWGFICDEAPKTDEFIRMHCDPEWETYITRIPHDQPLGSVEDENDKRVEYLANQMRDGFEFVQRTLGLRVSDEKLDESMGIWLRYTRKLMELYELMAADPQPLGGEEGAMFIAPMARPFNTGYEAMETALEITIEEVKQRVARQEGILPKGAPKLMSYAIPQSLPWITKMFEKSGVGLTFIEILMPGKKMVIPSRFDDPFMAAAETWLKRSQSVNIGYKADIICEKIETYGVDGMVFGFMDFDRWLGSDNRLLSKIVEKKTGLPVFYVEGDNWEDRDYSPEALKTRIESICEIVKMRKS